MSENDEKGMEGLSRTTRWGLQKVLQGHESS